MILRLDEDCWYYTVNVGVHIMGAKDECSAGIKTAATAGWE